MLFFFIRPNRLGDAGFYDSNYRDFSALYIEERFNEMAAAPPQIGNPESMCALTKAFVNGATPEKRASALSQIVEECKNNPQYEIAPGYSSEMVGGHNPLKLEELQRERDQRASRLAAEFRCQTEEDTKDLRSTTIKLHPALVSFKGGKKSALHLYLRPGVSARLNEIFSGEIEEDINVGSDTAVGDTGTWLGPHHARLNHLRE